MLQVTRGDCMAVVNSGNNSEEKHHSATIALLSRENLDPNRTNALLQGFYPLVISTWNQAQDRFDFLRLIAQLLTSRTL